MEKSIGTYTDIPLFDGIAEDDLRGLLHCLHGHEKQYQKGEILIMDEDDVSYVGIVLSGCVHMLKEDIWGRQTLFAYIRPGQLLGEVFAVQRERNACVSFVAATDARVLFISAENIIHDCPNRCAFHGRLVTNFFDLLGQKGVSLMEKIEVSSRPSLREKILAYLSLQAQKQGSRYITLPLNRTLLADFLGVNRSAMTREMAAMRREGLIDYDRNTFMLKQ